MTGLLLASALFFLPRAEAARVSTGIDVLEETGFAALKGKRIGLITNPTGKDGLGRATARVLAEAPGVDLAALFAPEHGFLARSEENAVSSTSVRLGGRDIPVHSLYAGGIAGMRPRPEDLKGLDAVVFDIQDIGARFYTYLATMGMALEETAKLGIPFVVLDRPNPIDGETIEGPTLEDAGLLRQVTATAYYPVPVRHGMTAGEIALLHNAEVRHPKLQVVAMRNWERAQWFDQTGLPWTPPSPNMPDLEAATLYPGIALFEASSLAVGRGTPVPFRWIGAPWLDAEKVVAMVRKARLKGVKFSVQDYTPTKSVFAGEPCHGVRMTITDRRKLRPTMVFLALNDALRLIHPKELAWRWEEARRMTGTEDFRKLHESGAPLAEMNARFERDIEAFRKARKPFLLY